MSLIRIAAVGVGSLLSIGSALARTETDAAGGTSSVPVPRVEERPAPAVAGEVPPGAEIHRGGGGVGFAAPHRDMQLAVIKQLLKAGDDEWKTLSPKVDKVLAAKQNLNTGAGMNWTARNNAKPVFQASSAKPDTAPGRAMQAVRDALDEEAEPDEQLIAKIAALRDARLRARADHEAAQKELLDALRPRQQAILMTLGVVE